MSSVSHYRTFLYLDPHHQYAALHHYRKSRERRGRWACNVLPQEIVPPSVAGADKLTLVFLIINEASEVGAYCGEDSRSIRRRYYEDPRLPFFAIDGKSEFSFFYAGARDIIFGDERKESKFSITSSKRRSNFYCRDQKAETKQCNESVERFFRKFPPVCFHECLYYDE
jgi:hypothetical protein